MSTPRHSQLKPSEAGADVADAAGIGLRIAEVGLVILAALLVAPPLFVVAIAVIVPTAVVLVVLAGLVGVIAAPFALVREVRAHHRTHRSTLFLHRLNWQAIARAPSSAREFGTRILR